MIVICFPNRMRDPNRSRTKWQRFGISFYEINAYEHGSSEKLSQHIIIFPLSYQKLFKEILHNNITSSIQNLVPKSITYEYHVINRYEYETITLLGPCAEKLPVKEAIRDFYNENFILALTTIFWSLCPFST